MAYPANRKSSPRKGINKGIPKPLITRTCNKCGEEYKGYNGTRYCSDRCVLLAGVTIAENGCWIWNRYVRTRPPYPGYGEFDLKNGKRMLAHRASYLLLKGEDPGKLCVCHTCDTPQCINPQHLWLGTRADNNADRDAKGRHGSKRAHG